MNECPALGLTYFQPGPFHEKFFFSRLGMPDFELLIDRKE